MTHFTGTVRKSDDLELTIHPFSHNSLTMKPPEAGVRIGKYRDNCKRLMYSLYRVTGSKPTVCEGEGGTHNDTPPANHKLYNDGCLGTLNTASQVHPLFQL